MIRAVALLLMAALAALSVGAASGADRVWPALYPEGPVWIGGDFFWAEMNADRVMRYDGDAPKVFFRGSGCGPTAIARFRKRDFVILCHLGARVLHVDEKGRTRSEIIATPDGTRLRNPNDVTSDGDGGVWFSDPGRFSALAPPEGRLFHLDANGRLTRHADALAYPNGVYAHPGTDALLVSEHLARRVLGYRPGADGLGPGTTVLAFARLGPPPTDYPEAGPDGLERAPDGALWIAAYGEGRLIRLDPRTGAVATRVVAPAFVTNIAFGPEGQVAITGSFENDRARNRGGVWLMDMQTLEAGLRPLD